MTLLDLLKKALGGLDPLEDKLKAVAEAAPDAAPLINELLGKLAGAVPVENLVALAAALPGEIADIAKGKLDPRDHPSDAA